MVSFKEEIEITKEMLKGPEIEIAVNKDTYLKKEDGGFYKILSYVIPTASFKPSSSYVYGSVIIANDQETISIDDAEFVVDYVNNVWIIKTCIIHDDDYFDIIDTFNKRWAGRKDRIRMGDRYYTRKDGKIFIAETHIIPPIKITDLKDSLEEVCVQGIVELYPEFYWLEKKPPQKKQIEALFCFQWTDTFGWQLEAIKPITEGWYEGIVHI